MIQLCKILVVEISDRAASKRGDTVDFHLFSSRNAIAKKFSAKALRPLKDWEKPYTINTDKTGAYFQTIRKLKTEGKLRNIVK